ncbi:MAG: HAD family hydrolase [Acidobacteriota bacterium]
MQVLACDFDGVLCDSSREVFVVAADAFAEKEPGSPLLSALARLRTEAIAGEPGYRRDPLVGSFLDLLPLGNRAEDFGVALLAIEAGLQIVDQDAYDRFFAQQETTWLESYHRLFYEARAKLRTNDATAWLRLHRPYPGLAETLRRHANECRMAVLTAKDGQSVDLLLAALDMKDLFDGELIFDKETGIHKTRHLGALHHRLEVDFTDITFVDDKVNHLQRAAGLGVRPVLAGWGFNTDREHSLAARLGYAVADLNTVEAVLFTGDH